MNDIKFFSFLMGLFFMNSAEAFTNNYSVKAEVNRQRTEIGNLVRLSVKVSGPGIISVSWNLFDSFLAKNKQIKIMTLNSIVREQIFEREIVFTSNIPGNLIIGQAHVIIHQSTGSDTIFTKSYHVDFVADKLPLLINDIKPIGQTEFLSEGLLLIICCILLFAAVFIWRGGLLKKDDPKSISQNKIREISLRKIQLLEEKISGSQSIDGNLKESLFIILKDYLNQSFAYDELIGSEESVLNHIGLLKLEGLDMDVLTRILKTSASLRFSDINQTEGTITKHLAEVKMFIINYPSPVL